ncbi:MAG: hypothetical protein JXQ91_07755 [Vannielia sp.]|uniref:hypothetical protein n=1 Tax=Vannielia sp. TaxID=2813045 RepID=UPI003B8AC0F6
MIYWLNEITAAASLVVLALCARGFVPWILLGSARDARTWVTLMALVGPSFGFFRMAYWDIYRPLRAYLLDGQMVVGSLEGTLINSAFNLGAGITGFCGLLALYYAIPTRRRAGWNIFTAPFYPDGFRIGLWRRKGE